ncbi:MAG: glycosyltransferase family 2 protein, partial [Planctomycetota bacterium]
MVFDVILIVLAAALAVPVLVLTVEVIASLFAGRADQQLAALGAPRPPVGIVIPAHNERAVLSRTLASIQSQTIEGDRILVVADNCEDDTADVARAAGVEVLERFDTENRGKGFALDAGVRYFEAGDDVPKVIIFNDADVLVGEHAVETLVRQCVASGLPVQGEYLMDAPRVDDAPRAVDLISRFAFMLKNRVRPLGLWKMEYPVPHAVLQHEGEPA